MPKPPKHKDQTQNPPIKVLGTVKKPPPNASKPLSDKREIGGPKGPEPTRYGDWETNGRCTDF